MRNRTWNQHCKGEGGRAEEENLIFFKSFGKDCLRGLFCKSASMSAKIGTSIQFCVLINMQV